MAGLAAAWELSRPEHSDHIAAITVYERSSRLGGKGASSRGIHGRIEEHGLHVWLGYYDNAFRLIREVYEELDRPRTDPQCPIKTWRDAFQPADLVGAAERDGSATPWLAEFGHNDLEPGAAPSSGDRPTSVVELAGRAVGLLLDAVRSLSRPDIQPPRRLFLSSSPDPVRSLRRRRDPLRSLATFDESLRYAEIGAVAAALQTLGILERWGRPPGSIGDMVVAQLADLRDDFYRRLRNDVNGSRTADLVDLVATVVAGMVSDRLLGDVNRFRTIDHLDFRAWLRRHGARVETTSSPLVNAMYDFVFAYEGGDPERPAFSAGLGLFLSTKLFFEYKGSIFWKLAAGMGDVVFAPLYQALRARGVRFRLLHSVQNIVAAADQREIDEIVLERAGEPDGAEGDALVRVKGLPCFPSPRPASGDRTVVKLRHGVDFDQVVLAIPLGALPRVCAGLIEASPAWERMVANVRTVPTHAFQAWLTCTEADLGWKHAGATVSGRTRPFDTYASMSHVLPMEDWSANGDAPQSVVYFCSVLDRDGSSSGADPTREAARRMLAEGIGDVWPEAVGPAGFRWEVLHGGFDAQYFTTNSDESDRYVQSLPGTGKFRLRADKSGYANMSLAGDWTNSGLNAGCIEAATISGVEAANVVLGRELTHGVSGSLYGLVRPGQERK
jgi:uncharacterized protein with NAD-binding domain and iron-sulfur cluster